MKRILFVAVILFASVFTPGSFVNSQTLPSKVELSVPYVSEVPDGRWTGSWKNACEEASIAMVDAFYSGQKKVSIANAKAFMQKLFVIERKLWGSDANSNTEQTLKLINDNSSFSGRIADNPTIEDIKAELDAGRPVITPINGFTLANKHIPFLPSGSAYHMFVIVGYDELAREYIVNDTGDTTDGPGHRYSYNLIMKSLHDYDSVRQKTDGPVRAIFTYPKLVKTASSHRIYFLHDGVKQYVSHPAIFAQRKWDWSWVNLVSDSFLNGFKDGAAINKK
jgi:hypothetical protein